MAPFDSSPPLPIRHHNALPRTSSISSKPIVIDDEDELAGDTVPCSPAAFLPPREPTQPTQLLSSSSQFPDRSSSPGVIEVPASSPMQAPKRLTPLGGSRLAPAGTMFRPPPRQQPPLKRPAPAIEPIVLSDDEDDTALPRGDIRPTTFKAQISSFRYDPSTEEQSKRAIRQIWDVFGDRYPPELVRKALKTCQQDVEDAIDWLERHGKKFVRPPVSRKRSSSEDRPDPSKVPKHNVDSQASTPPRPKPNKRRLVQGLRHRSSPASQPVKVELPPPPSSDDPLVINLIDDKEDTYQAEESPEPSEDGDGKILNCINTSELKELAAMTGMREEQVKPLIDQRPFADLGAARAVTVLKKPGSRKSISVGENVVDAVEVFMTAVEAIDEVVATCEAKAKTVKDVMDVWDLDTFGNLRDSAQSKTDDELPPTPTSSKETKLIRPPVPRQPSYLDGHCQMKPFQLFGLNWMSLLYNYNIGCILADEMGLGKTCQVISFIAHLVEDYEKGSRNEDQPWPNLIVVPPSTYNNWLAEFQKFAPDLSVIGYRGSQSERSEIAYEIAENPGDYHAVLATYSQINSDNDIEAMASFGLNAAIFDEGHKMKNPGTKIYKDLRRIPSAWKMLLTGTPVQNNLMEMTSLLNFINPSMFDGYMHHIQFIFSHKVTIRDVSNGAFLYTERVQRARTILEPFILQRRKEQVVADLPKKYTTVVECEMTPAQKTAYDDYEALFKLEPSQRAKHVAKEGRGNDVNNVWMQLRKAALHPLLFRRHFTNDITEKMAVTLMKYLDQSELQQPNIEHLKEELRRSSDFRLKLWCRDYPTLLKEYDIPDEAELDSGKVKKLLEMIAQYRANGDRVLVFSKFALILEILDEVLAKQDIPHLTLWGTTKVEDRQDIINEFNENADIPVFILTTDAGGTGINLTAANKVIIFDQSDNPQHDIQAENRAHRLGQTRDVEIVRLLSKGTIEGLIYEACQKKIELANKVTGVGTGDDDVDTGEKMETTVRKMMKEQLTPP